MAGAAPGLESGTNLTRVKDFNEVVVLGLIRSRGGLTRPAVAEATGLTLQTVANISRRLLQSGVLLEAPADGRRRVLTVNDEAAYALGIQLDRDELSVAVVNLAGEIKARGGFALDGTEPPATVIDRMAAVADGLIDEAQIPRDRLLGAGIGAPGPLDVRRGRLLSPLHFGAWDDFPLRDAAAGALGLKAILDNDATAAALGEQWRGLGAGVANFIYVYAGRGLGSGLILDGQAFRGLRGNAGEISHIQVDPGGPPCECGLNGCLGLYATPDGLVREARRAASERRLANTPRTLRDVLEGPFEDVRARGAGHLARVVTELTRVLDPELIVLGGPLAAALGEDFRHAIHRRLGLLDGPPPPRVELSRIGSDAGVVGAATLVLHDLYAPTLGKLSLAGLAGSGPGAAPPPERAPR